jgi:hypothetical protein
MFVQDYTFVEMFEPFNENLEVTVSMLGDFDPYELWLEHDRDIDTADIGLFYFELVKCQGRSG